MVIQAVIAGVVGVLSLVPVYWHKLPWVGLPQQRVGTAVARKISHS